MKTYPLDSSVSATFVSDGAGGSVARAQIGPTVFGTLWRVKSVASQTTSDMSQFGSSQLLIYQDTETPSRFAFGTFNAENDVASGDETLLLTLSKLVFIWTKGNIGSIATATIRGIVEEQR